MKIVRVETFTVEPRWVFVKLTTDQGIHGWGESLGDKAPVIAAAVHSYEDGLLGQDPRRIQHLWQTLYRGAFWRGGPVLNAAISGIEMALWDILGKSLGVPVYQLLGGAVRDRIRVYSRPQGDLIVRGRDFGRESAGSSGTERTIIARGEKGSLLAVGSRDDPFLQQWIPTQFGQ